jgi:hypothetical protein
MIRDQLRISREREGVTWTICAAWGVAIALAACGGSSSTSSDGNDAGAQGQVDGGANGADGEAPGTDASADGSVPGTAGTVLLIAGGGTGGVDGTGAAADLGSPSALAYDGAGTMYVADSLLRIVKVDLATGAAAAIAGSHHATGLAFDTTNNALYYIDELDAVLTRYDVASGVATPVAGVLGSKMAVDGMGTSAHFQKPGRLTWSNGFIYMTDACAIRSFEIATSTVATIVGSATECAYKEGAFAAARFGSAAGAPLGLVMGPSQTLFVADRNNYVIRAVHLDTKTTELVAGSSYGHSDGVGASASFQEVKDVTWDAAHSRLYVAGTGGTIRGIQLGQPFSKSVVTTVAGAWPGEGKFAPGSPGSLIRPAGVAFVGSDVIGADLHVLFRVTGL